MRGLREFSYLDMQSFIIHGGKISMLSRGLSVCDHRAMRIYKEKIARDNAYQVKSKTCKIGPFSC